MRELEGVKSCRSVVSLDHISGLIQRHPTRNLLTGDRVAIDVDIVLTKHDDSSESAIDDRGSAYKRVEEGNTDWVMIHPKGSAIHSQTQVRWR